MSKTKRLLSKDGQEAVIHYTTVTNGNGELVNRYFAVPCNKSNQRFIAGFISREEAIEWWENSIQGTTYIKEEQCQSVLSSIQQRKAVQKQHASQ